ncbi:XRE family transcriptional regulator [Alteromonadaceae bacterium M269]|nr:XRE family transcriptional regulator [Alteromonadaceae bacterium M269]
MQGKTYDPDNLRKIRKAAGYSQDELAARLGCSRKTIIHIESSRPGTIDKLAMPIVERWWTVCRQRMSNDSRLEFVQELIKYFNIEDLIKTIFSKSK